MYTTRREFLTEVGRGAVAATVGVGLAADLGMALAEGPEPRLTFGALEPLAGLLQETPPDKLLPLLAAKVQTGTALKDLVAAAALANARSFGGEDYVGFHTFMALAPAHHMARELPEGHQALPVLKVLYRNSKRIQEWGGGRKEILHPVEAAGQSGGKGAAEALCAAVQRKDMKASEQTFAALDQPDDAFNTLLHAVQESTEVHRVVLAYRSWETHELTGTQHARTLLRQSLHYCVRQGSWPRGPHEELPKVLLPKLLDQYKLVAKPLGTRAADDVWVEALADTIFRNTPAGAADAAAAALGEGMDPAAVGEAVALAANQLVLRDVGRLANQVAANKPVGSVHGDSIGVHACDSAHAWRNLARVSNPRNTVACLILGAYQVALDRAARGGDFLKWQPYPRPEALAELTTTDQAALLKEADAAVRNKDQARASAAIQRYGAQGGPARAAFDLLLKYAVSEDGALHAEKYYRTVTEEFAASRPAFRWRQLVALARVTASAYGYPADGYADACKLLKV